MSKSKIKTLSDRMKEYEAVSDIKLTKRTPVIARIDGRAFHTYTRGLDKPFDEIFQEAMGFVCDNLLQTVQGCKLAYTQSDEISLLITDWEKINTDSYFDYRIQKMASILASSSTMYFNQFVMELVLSGTLDEKTKAIWERKMNKAMFDARVFNLPKEEVCNYFIWRQEDASRNSVQSLGRSKFSYKQMLNKSNDEVQDMLFKEYNINWNNIPTKWKRGYCLYKYNGDIGYDFEIPIFKQDRNFINRFLEVEDE